MQKMTITVGKWISQNNKGYERMEYFFKLLVAKWCILRSRGSIIH